MTCCKLRKLSVPHPEHAACRVYLDQATLCSPVSGLSCCDVPARPSEYRLIFRPIISFFRPCTPHGGTRQNYSTHASQRHLYHCCIRTYVVAPFSLHLLVYDALVVLGLDLPTDSFAFRSLTHSPPASQSLAFTCLSQQQISSLNPSFVCPSLFGFCLTAPVPNHVDCDSRS